MKSWVMKEWMLVQLIILTAIISADAQSCTEGTTVFGGYHNNTLTGRVSICDGRSWKAVCGDGWDMTDAIVVCRELGFPTEGTQLCNNSCYGGNIFINGTTNFKCTGEEQSLLNCNYDYVTTGRILYRNGVRIRPCPLFAGVLCTPDTSNPSTTTAGIKTTRSNTDSNIASTTTAGETATIVLGVVCVFLLLTLMGMAAGWVWSFYRKRQTVQQQQCSEDNNITNPTYIAATPTTPPVQYSSLGPRDTPTLDHTPGEEEGVYHMLGEVGAGEGQEGGGAYEVPFQMGRDENAGRMVHSTLHHN